jgi:hypothetical protein
MTTARARLLLTIVLIAISTALLPLDAQTLPRWTATRELLIDGQANNLVPVRFVRADPAGRIYFTQMQDANIRVFSPDGVLLRTVGRRGNGPGEFQGLGRIGLHGDTLWASELRDPQRVVLFSAAGKHLRTTSMEHMGGKAFAYDLMPRAVLRDGTLIGEGKLLPKTGPRPKIDTLSLVRMKPNGDVLRTFGTRVGENLFLDILVRPSRLSATFFSAYDDEGRWQLWSGNPPSAETSIDGEYVAVARAALSGPDSGTVHVALARASGDTVYARRFPAWLQPIPASVVDSAFAELARNPSYAGQVTGRARPAVYPPTEYLRVARDGAVLIAFYTTGAERDFLLIDPQGRPVATLRLPSAVRVHQVDGSMLWGTLRDGDGVDSVVRYRIGG